jgi:hypothetical protein
MEPLGIWRAAHPVSALYSGERLRHIRAVHGARSFRR